MSELSSSSEDVTTDDPVDELIESALRVNDGIHVDTQPVPVWWGRILAATALLAVPYMAYYHTGASGRSLSDRHALAAAENARLQFAEIGDLQGDEATLTKYMNEPNWLLVGQSVFNSNCTACHGKGGLGLIGPNLADDAYKNARSITDLYKIVNQGAAGGAMPAWEAKLHQNERVLVAAYVASLRGTSGGEGKAAEGSQIPAWPTFTEKAESVATSE